MALTYAFAAVDALTGSDGGLTAMALAYDAAVRPEADDVYRESAAMDRSWIYRMIGQEVPPEDREEMERQDLIPRGVVPGAAHDLVLGRAQLKRMNLIDAPGAILDDPEVVTRARRVRERVASKPSPKLGPDRDEMRTILSGVDRT